MNILFVRNYPSVDGVFTLLLRLGNKFKQDGHNMFYIDFGVKSEFDKEIAEIFVLLTPQYLSDGKNLPDIDVLFPFADGDLLYWSIRELKNRYFKYAKFVIGVYHPRAYYTSTYLGPSPDTGLHKLIFQNIPSQNILFMNEVVKREHEIYFSNKFLDSPIIPLPVNLEYKNRNFGIINRKKIVSIGRLATSKCYIIPMINIIQELNNEGYDFEFYIYGHGQLEIFLKNYIAEKKLGMYIFLMGKVNYGKLYSVLEDAFMFVGMGTTIIEASSMGVPSLLAIDSEKSMVTNGFFDKLKGFCIGEVILELPLVNMKDSIIGLSKMNELEYKELSLNHIKKANTFNIDVIIEQYYKFFSNASNIFKFRISNFNQITTKLLRQVFKVKFLTKLKYRTK